MEQNLRRSFEAKLPVCIVRAENTQIVPVIPNHYFSAASSEIRDMFIDGYFIGAITLSQSVAEGLSKFVCKRKHMPTAKDHLARVNKLLSENTITCKVKTAFETIEESRNDFHHMNENIESNYLVLEKKAEKNIEALFTIEEYIFSHSFDNGKIIPKNPEYWDIKPNGTIEAFLRFPT